MRVTPGLDLAGGPFFISQANNIQSSPEIAYGGNYMVVWQDCRAAASTSVIYGSRVTPAGTVLDPAGIQIGTSGLSGQNSPAVAYTGTRFFCAWGYASGSTRITGVLGRFIEPNGSLTDTLRIANAASDVYTVRAAASGTNLLVIWTDFVNPDYCVIGQLLSNTGAPIGGPFTIADAIYSVSLALCFDGTNYFVLYSSATDYAVWGVKISPSGSFVEPPCRISDTGIYQDYYDVVPGTNNSYFNVWNDCSGSDYNLYGNLDVVITGVEEGPHRTATGVRLVTYLAREAIILENFDGAGGAVFDVAGKEVGRLSGGYFDCRGLERGVYFVRVEQAGSVSNFKVIKI